jgi:hypothetical protein
MKEVHSLWPLSHDRAVAGTTLAADCGLHLHHPASQSHTSSSLTVNGDITQDESLTIPAGAEREGEDIVAVSTDGEGWYWKPLPGGIKWDGRSPQRASQLAGFASPRQAN